MVANWSPDPSKNKEDTVFREPNHVITLDEDSEDDNTFPFFGYELLPHDINNEFTRETELESDSDGSEPRDIIQEDEVINETLNKSVDFEDLPRQDIVINLDEVREAMSNITLPDSAIPPWAAEIPESQWTSFLLSRIRNIQNPNQNL